MDKIKVFKYVTGVKCDLSPKVKPEFIENFCKKTEKELAESIVYEAIKCINVNPNARGD